MKNIQIYSDFVEILAREKQDKVFFNSGPNHAAIVMSRIFKYSQNSVKIYCGGFSGTVSNDPDYLYYLEDFLKRNGRATILAEKDLSRSDAKVFPVLCKYPSQASIYTTSLRVTNGESRKSIHFTIGDRSMLRLETNVEDFTAQVNFGDQQTAEKFIKIFDDMLKSPQSKPIALS